MPCALCAGASWSSIDYGGVWKPVQYGVARAFADVALNVRHDVQQGVITVSLCDCSVMPLVVPAALGLPRSL